MKQSKKTRKVAKFFEEYSNLKFEDVDHATFVRVHDILFTTYRELKEEAESVKSKFSAAMPHLIDTFDDEAEFNAEKSKIKSICHKIGLSLDEFNEFFQQLICDKYGISFDELKMVCQYLISNIGEISLDEFKTVFNLINNKHGIPVDDFKVFFK